MPDHILEANVADLGPVFGHQTTVDGKIPAPVGNYWELRNTVNDGIITG